MDLFQNKDPLANVSILVLRVGSRNRSTFGVRPSKTGALELFTMQRAQRLFELDKIKHFIIECRLLGEIRPTL